jgi:FkbM family methyltransferase
MYGQEAEADLLARLLPHLRSSTVVDVGAEHGAFTAYMLQSGSEQVHAFEPAPDNAAVLRQRFADEPRVVVHECAVGEADGEGDLRLAVNAKGEPISFGHTLLEREDTEDIAWTTSITVPVRTLDSLITAGELPSLIGVLKIDTEGGDFAVANGMGALDCDVIMVEHWEDLPRSLGRCPWTSDEMTHLLGGRGFNHVALFAHHREFTAVQWDDPQIPAGRMGNLVFVHDRIMAAGAPQILVRVSAAVREIVTWGEAQADAARERLVSLGESSAAHELLTTQARQLEAQLAAIAEERDLHMSAGEQRLSTIADLVQERDRQASAAEERLAALDQLSKERDLLARVAAERLQAIEDLTGAGQANVEGHQALVEDLRRAVAELQTQIKRLEQERDLQTHAADERLGTIEELKRDRDSHRQAAEERLAALEELAGERDRQALVAEQRLAAIEGLDRDRNTERGQGGWR